VSITAKIVVGAASAAMAVGLVAVAGGGSAFAAGRHAQRQPHATVTGTGKETCTGVSGSISFSPPLTSAGGSSTETVKVSAKLSGCSGGTPAATSGTVKSTILTNTNSCTGLANPPATQTETLIVKWSPKTIATSTTVFGPDTAVSSPHIGFTLSNGTTKGSYAGSGANSQVLSNETTAAYETACASKAGLKKLTLTSGSVSG
jgi:hypothetical protein